MFNFYLLNFILLTTLIFFNIAIAQEPTPVTHFVEKRISPERSTAPISKQEQAFRMNEAGVAQILRGEQIEGMRKIEQALELDPNNTTIRYNLAGLYISHGRAALAIQILKAATELDDVDLSLRNRLAEAYFADNDISSATKQYEKIVSIDPKFEKALYRLGTLYGMEEKWAQAEQTLINAAKNDDDVRILTNLGSIYIVQSKYKDAVPVLEKAHSRNASFESAHGLGLAYEGLGDLEKALSFYEVALNLDSDNTEGKNSLARIKEMLSKESKSK
jgi:tetratricopeptide (TPR) repeat protein